MPTERPISVAEACEMMPGDDDSPVWVNAGVTGVVQEATARTAKSGKKMWMCLLRDSTGSATIRFTLFRAPNFNPGDVVDVTGKGIRRTEYNGAAELSLGKSVEIHKLGRSVADQSVASRSVPVSEPEPEPAEPAQPVNGQTVGMAVKEALQLCGPILGHDQITTPEFWRQVHQAASDIIRVSRTLERGILAPSPRARARNASPPPSPRAEQPTPAPEPAPAPKPAPAAKIPDEDVPF